MIATKGWCLVPAVVFEQSAIGAVSPAAVALLRGVEEARTRYDSLRVNLVLERIAPAPAESLRCLIEMDGDQRRFEIFSGNRVEDSVILIKGHEFYGYRRHEHEDLHLYDMERAVGIRGDVAFDPRIIGLSTIMSADTTVKSLLWYENPVDLEIIGREMLNGVSVRRLKATMGDSTESEYWIEDSAFRVHRRTVTSSGISTKIDSHFSNENSSSPFPNKVSSERTDSSGTVKRTIEVSKFEYGVPLSPDRFTLAQLELPINTAVVDYRMMRRIGYWNGEGLQENPVSADRQLAADRTEPERVRRFGLIAINIVIVFALAFFVWLRWRASPAR